MGKKDKIKGIIFDLGGVLVETFEKEFLECASKQLKVSKNKLATIIQQEEPALQRGKITSIEFWHRVCGKLGIEYLSDKVLQTLWIKPYKKHAKINNEMLKFVKKIRNNYKLAVLSNTIKDHSQINRKRNLFDYFDKVLLSDKVRLRKPEKEFFNEASKRLGIPFKNLIFIDDETRWVKAAKKHGLNAILFKTVDQLKKSLGKFGIRVD